MIQDTLYNGADGLLIALPPGKPNPSESYALGFGERRSRLIQSAYKDEDSWYYGLKRLRPSVGKEPPKELREERRIELRFRAHFKKLRAWKQTDLSVPMQQALVKLVKENLLLWNMNRQMMREFIAVTTGKRYEEAKAAGYPRLKIDPKETTMLETFLEQAESDPNRPQTYGDLIISRDREELLLKAKEEAYFAGVSEIIRELLEAFGVDYKKRFAEEYAQDPHGYTGPLRSNRYWDQLSVENEMRMLLIYRRRLAVEQFHLPVSTWQPADGCQKLIEELRAKGPLCVGASFGREAYAAQPLAMKQLLGGRTIYYWQKGTPFKETFNTLVLIGARLFQQNDKDFQHVYFIDPADPSDPNDLSLQRIYAVSYETLSYRLLDLRGVLRSSSSFGYAVYAPPRQLAASIAPDS